MKYSKSQKHITILTDRKSPPEMLMSLNQRPHSRGPHTCTHARSPSPSSQFRVPSSCVNRTQRLQQPGFRNEHSAGKCHRSDSNSSVRSHHRYTSSGSRRNELDCLCFHRVLNQLKRHLGEVQEKWDLQALCYEQMLKFMWLCRYVPYDTEQAYIANHEQTELKKVFCLWISLATRRTVKFTNLMKFVQIIENISVSQEFADSTLFVFSKELQEMGLKVKHEQQLVPKYSFFMKKLELGKNSEELQMTEGNKQKILSYFSSFKLNKLKDSGLSQCVKPEEEQVPLVSQRSTQLAEQKRKKMTEKIRQKKPHIENINLLDLLSYREKDHLINKNPERKMKKPMLIQRKIDKNQLRKDIQSLSKPKLHYQQRLEDEVAYTSSQHEYTFQPKINPCRVDTKQKVLKIKNADKMLVRMREARQQKQLRESILQKGYMSPRQPANPDKQNTPAPEPTSPKPPKYEVSKDYLRIPILYIDVNIEEGKKQRIVIYDNDTAEALAQQFGAKHGLTEETVKRLEGLLKQQMDTVLARIDEETEDECSILY